MNRLQLAQRLHLFLGAGDGSVPGTLPLTTLAQTGDLGRMVMSVDEALLSIESDTKNWLWMRRRGLLPLVSGVQTYPVYQTSTAITAAITGRMATATTAVAHGRAAGDAVTIAGAVETQFNGAVTIYDVPTTTTFRYLLVGAPTTPATGTITYTVPPSAVPLSITTLVASSAVVTVTATDHGLILAQTVYISGATPAAYNGTQTIVEADTDTFKYLVAIGTTTPATGTLALSGSSTLTRFDETRPKFAANASAPYITCYETAIGTTGEQPVYYMTPHDFDGYLNRGSFASSTGRPCFYTELPGRRLVVAPTPDRAYTLILPFRTRPLVMVADADTTDMPDEFHMAIVYKAAMAYAGADENSRQYSTASARFRELYDTMCIQQRPRMTGRFGAAW